MQTPAVLDEFLESCIAAAATVSSRSTIYTAMRHLFAEPAALADLIPPFADEDVVASERGFRLGGEHVVHRDQHLTMMVLDTLPGVVQPPHEHNMNVFIGVFEGAEEQRFWSRTDTAIVPTQGRIIGAGEVMLLGTRAVHAISAPTGQAARSIHVYLGDIYGVERSIFDPETLAEHAMTTDRYDEFCRPADK